MFFKWFSIYSTLVISLQTRIRNDRAEDQNRLSLKKTQSICFKAQYCHGFQITLHNRFQPVLQNRQKAQALYVPEAYLHILSFLCGDQIHVWTDINSVNVFKIASTAIISPIKQQPLTAPQEYLPSSRCTGPRPFKAPCRGYTMFTFTVTKAA